MAELTRVAYRLAQRAISNLAQHTNAIQGGKTDGTIELRLRNLGIELPGVTTPIANYVPVRLYGPGKLFAQTAGQIPLVSGELKYKGKVGSDISLADAIAAARICALNGVAALKGAIGTLDNVLQVIHVEVMVNSAPDFTDQSKVANGVSDLLVEIFGEIGKHTRIAVGNNELPLGASVEVTLKVQLVGPIGRVLRSRILPI